ncbi:MAG TPA: hypothetical protein ENN80_15060, partial [Candidatus Hydrogenedentes bacterium]|nr:hypothetical protein [Candidatus Hydrogenedentota bacterium]
MAQRSTALIVVMGFVGSLALSTAAYDNATEEDKILSAQQDADMTLDGAFDALALYDYGASRVCFEVIREAVRDTHGDFSAREALLGKLAALLRSDASIAAKDFACRQLAIIGTSEEVPALAELLRHDATAGMAQYALAHIPGAEAQQALLHALPESDGVMRIG